MRLTVTVEREEDGRVIAAVEELSGVWVYGLTEQEAVHRAQALALMDLADKLQHGETDTPLSAIEFVLPSPVA